VKRILTVLGLACMMAEGAAAADLSAIPGAEPDWQFSVNAYAWASGLKGEVGTLPPLPAVDVDIGFDQIIQNLDGAFMGTGEARRGNYMLFTDLIATKISPKGSFTVNGVEGDVNIESSSLMGLAAGGYRMMDADGFTLDGFLGVRAIGLKNTLTVEGPAEETSFSDKEAWVDAVAGARARYALNENWSLIGIGFAGAGGAKHEWDIYGGLGYNFNKSWSGFAGYRALGINYEKGDFVYDTIQQGPVLGVQIRF
jgi:hypothetical protein